MRKQKKKWNEILKILWEIERIPSYKQGRYYLTWLIFFLIDGFDFLSSHLDGSPSPLPPPPPITTRLHGIIISCFYSSSLHVCIGNEKFTK